METKYFWRRIRLFSWFRATLASCLYILTKKHMKKHLKEFRPFLAELGPKTFNRPLLTHRIGITTEWKRADKLSRDNTKARESILEEDLAKSVSLSVYNSFCLNRESNVNKLSNYLKSLQEQRVDTGLQATENRGRNRDQLR